MGGGRSPEQSGVPDNIDPSRSVLKMLLVAVGLQLLMDTQSCRLLAETKETSITMDMEAPGVCSVRRLVMQEGQPLICASRC